MEWKLFADLAERAGRRRIPVDLTPGASVRDALEALLSTHPDLRDRVLTADGELREHINVLRNGHSVGELDDAVDEDDELALLPPVSGG